MSFYVNRLIQKIKWLSVSLSSYQIQQVFARLIFVLASCVIFVFVSNNGRPKSSNFMLISCRVNGSMFEIFCPIKLFFSHSHIFLLKFSLSLPSFFITSKQTMSDGIPGAHNWTSWRFKCPLCYMFLVFPKKKPIIYGSW